MSIVYQTDKKSGITYSYESKVYLDKEKQSHSKRALIGRGIQKQARLRKQTEDVKRTALIKLLSLHWTG